MDDRELNKEGCSGRTNFSSDEPSSDAVTMETAEAAEQELYMTNLPGSRSASPTEEEDQVCPEADSPEPPGKKVVLDILADLPGEQCGPAVNDNGRFLHGTESPRQKEALFLESGRSEELNRNESIASSMSDTLSSQDSVCENEAHRKRQDSPEVEVEPEVELEVEPELGFPEPCPEDDDDDPGVEAEKAGYEDEEAQYDPPVIGHVPEESILEQYIREEAMSDASNESVHDFYPEEIDECLRVEIAAASSDSESEGDKWRAIFSSSINKEDDDSYLDSLQLSAQELFVQKVEVRNMENNEGDDDGNYVNNNDEDPQVEFPQEEEVLEQPDDVLSFSAPPQEVTYNPMGLHSLSKISEDESENGKDWNHNINSHKQNVHHHNSDPNKKLPKDFCVIQETKSENVSMEHVDFQLARKQWLEMEETTKNLVLCNAAAKPPAGGFHGSHSFMYTPVRNLERPAKKSHHDLESLSLTGDYPHTQFSPCSEDSGLDDSSYRSPYDDPETPVEKEIRVAMEREENFRRERGFSKMGKSTDCAPSRSIPKSPSVPLTPSFIITSSPAKGPMRQGANANNVIILEPDRDITSGARRNTAGKDMLTAYGGEWCSDDSNSNVIILETSGLIIRSASEFSLNTACEQQPQESTFLNNPFFKLRSRSTLSLVDEEIKMVQQREEELKKERANVYSYNGSLAAPNMMDSLSFSNSVDMPMKCKSSPSSPMKTAYKMDRSVLSCDHRFPEVYNGGRRKSAMALRWEAGEFANNE